jgi:hypothetical protein
MMLSSVSDLRSRLTCRRATCDASRGGLAVDLGGWHLLRGSLLRRRAALLVHVVSMMMMMVWHDAHCHTHMAVVLVKRVNGRLVFRCDESNETFMAHPNSTAAVLLCCFQAFEIWGSDARLSQFTCLIRVNAARRFDRSQFQQGKSHELPSLLDDTDGKKKVKIISGYHVLVAC